MKKMQLKRLILCSVIALGAWQYAAAQTTSLKEGDPVRTPDGRTGVMESFKPGMGKVKFGDGSTKFYMLEDLQKVEPPKPVRQGPAEIFRPGDTVVRSNGQRLTIDSVSGDSAVVRSAPGKYMSYTVKLDELVSLKTWERRQNEEKEGKLTRAAFEDDAKAFDITVHTLAPTYFSNVERQFSTGITDSPETYDKWRSDLEGLAAVCQKYPNLTNSPSAADPLYGRNIRYRHADWCVLAREREAVIRKMMLYIAEKNVETTVNSWVATIEQRLRNWDGYVRDDIQTLLFDRAAWERKELAPAAKKYAALGEKIPAAAFAPLEETLDKLKARIEEDVKTRVWQQPALQDAALEALARREFSTDLPGAKVFKTGMTNTTWQSRDDKSFIGSDSNYRFYRITPGAYRFKLGLALVQLPNRPYCQIREFQLTQYKAGAGYGSAKASVGTTGMFVKCP